jgi:Permease family
MLATTGTMHARRIQGGILADGTSSHCQYLQYHMALPKSSCCASGFRMIDTVLRMPFDADVMPTRATGCNSFFGAIAMTLPSTTFAQNNGVISLTRCASRWAGIACGIWLIIFGVLAKVGGWVTTIPGDAVLSVVNSTWPQGRILPGTAGWQASSEVLLLPASP